MKMSIVYISSHGLPFAWMFADHLRVPLPHYSALQVTSHLTIQSVILTSISLQTKDPETQNASELLLLSRIQRQPDS